MKKCFLRVLDSKKIDLKKCLVARVFMKRKSEGEGGENVSERAGERV